MFKRFLELYRTYFVRQHTAKLDIEYMGEVEAALYRQGNPWAYRFSRWLVILFFLFLVWSCFAERDEVIRGDGHIMLSRGVQPIQSAEGGIITEILVSENEEVEKDQILARLSNIQAIAEFHNLKNKQVEYTLTLIRLTAEDTGTELDYDAEASRNYPDVVRDQMRLFISRQAQFVSEGRALELQLEQKRGEVQEAQRRRGQYEKSLLLLKQQEERVRPLWEKRTYPETEYLNLRQRIITQEGELNALAQTISRAQSAVIESEGKLKNREPERKAKIADEMNKYRQELDATEESLNAMGDKVDRTDLKSPMRAVIKRIILKRDSVARQAETIMEVLPLDDSLEVVARFHPKERGFLDVGQEALIKISAYDFSVYGALEAKVTKISADTIEDSRGAPWYEVRLQTTRNTLPKKDDLELKVGMTVQVDVHTGKKSVFNYLMKPILKTQIKQNVVTKALNATSPD